MPFYNTTYPTKWNGAPAPTKPARRAKTSRPVAHCMECGYKYRTIAAAERAFMDGCPKCGSVRWTR